MGWKVQLCELNYTLEESRAVERVISSKWLTMGENVKKFENKFSQFLGEKSLCSAVSSCTAALHISILGLNLKAKDEIIMPALTFVANANVIKLSGCKPVLADIESLQNPNLSIETIKKVATKKTKAIYIVHFAGFPCDVEPIAEFCKRNNIYLIEDVAHAPGASINGRNCGTFGDVSCFSFYSNKNLSTGEGGMIVTRDKKLHERFQKIRSHGMTAATLDRHEGRAFTYDVISPGLNYRFDEIKGALGLVQLSKLKRANNKRKKLSERYLKNLKNSPLMLPFSQKREKFESSHHIMPVLLPKNTNKEEVINFLKNFGIQTSMHYPSFHNFSFYKKFFSKNKSPVSSEFIQRELTLPLYPDLKFKEVDYVCDSIKKYFDDKNF